MRSMNVKYPTFHDTFARFVNRVLASPAAAESTPHSALVPPCISLLLLLLALPRFDRVPSPPSTTPFSCHTTPLPAAAALLCRYRLVRGGEVQPQLASTPRHVAP